MHILTAKDYEEDAALDFAAPRLKDSARAPTGEGGRNSGGAGA